MICIFKCPGCNGNMTFDIEKQKLVCQSCGTEIDAEDYDEKQIVFEGGREYSEGIICYRCPTCSAEVEVDSSQATCTCRYCGIEMAVFAEGNGRMSPEKIIPFELEQEEAETAFCKWWLEHDTMPDFNRKKMKFTISPMYLPVWLVNANTKTDMSAVVRREESVGGTYSYGQSPSWSMQNNMTFSDRERRTRDYLIHKSLYSKFYKVPSVASYHFSSTRFFGIEPYNYLKLEDFAPAYISGLPAEHYSIEASDIIPRSLKRIKGFGVEQCKTYILGSSTGESEIVEEAGCIQSIELKQVIYAMVPVWICSYTYMGKKHKVYVNGQTGKVDGEVVTSKERMKSYSAVLFLSTYLEFFDFMLLLISMCSMYMMYGDLIPVVGGMFIAFFVGSLTGNLSNRVSNKKGGKNETMDLYSDIDYVKKDLTKPKHIAIRRIIIGTLFSPVAWGFSRLPSLQSHASSNTVEALLITFVLTLIWTILFMEIHLKKEKEQKPAEYNDYLNMSVTDILESSEQVY